MSREIPNEQLTSDVIPKRGAGWSEIVTFASTFDAYSHWEEPWEHSDWSNGIPVAEYVEMVRRGNQPAEKAYGVFRKVVQSHASTGTWDFPLTELRTVLFLFWRAQRNDGSIPDDLTEYYDLLDAIRAKVESREYV